MITRLKPLILIATIGAATLVSATYIWSKSNTHTEETNFNHIPVFPITPEPWSLTYTNQKDISHVAAAAAVLIDENTGEIIAARNEDAPLPIASTTKIMTAAVVMEFADPNSLVTIPEEVFNDLPPDSALMGISAGERYSVEELLYGLLLTSGNDAANALAFAVSGNQEKFVSLMNGKTQQLGLTSTQFKNPSGLDHPDHYSTAKELAIITHYARQFSLFKEIVATPGKTLPFSQNHRYLELTNLNPFINSYPGATGVKPGNTGEAGNCLVASVNRGGQRYIGILLNTPGRNSNMAKLFDVAFE